MTRYPLWLCWWLFICGLCLSFSIIALLLQCYMVFLDLLLLLLFNF